LRNVPGSRLWLQNNQMQAEFRRLLLGKFRNLGIDDHRITLAAGASRDQLLDTFKQIDISLDSWPYCGGNTIAEALWMGLPVVTLYGDRFSSRYGASLLAAAGCSDLVAHSPEEYIAIATKLATDPARLTFLRNNLRAMSLRHGLGDSALFARRLEAAYREMLSALTAKRIAAPGEPVLSKQAAQ
jgi:predicted O-linked N-acetylglucosamine transferase (SPINDLY family)